MRKIKNHLKRVSKALSATNALLQAARYHWLLLHKRAISAHKKSQKAQKRAKSLQLQKHDAKAARQQARADEFGARASQLHDQAENTVDRVKALANKRDGLVLSKDALKADAKAWKDAHGIKIDGNKVTGGTLDERLSAAIRAAVAYDAAGKRHSFYSQAGSWDVEHCITGEIPGHRSDCSSWFTSVYWSAGGPDPNGNGFNGGYTGTLGTHGREISRSQATRTPAAAVLFGTAPFHHVEAALGDGSEITGGHGSTRVDRGTFDLLPGPKQFRAYA